MTFVFSPAARQQAPRQRGGKRALQDLPAAHEMSGLWLSNVGIALCVK